MSDVGHQVQRVPKWRRWLVVAAALAAVLVLTCIGFVYAPAFLAVGLALTKAVLDASVSRTARWRISTAMGAALGAVALVLGLRRSITTTPTSPNPELLGVLFGLAEKAAFLGGVLCVFGVGVAGTHLFFWVTKWKVRVGPVRHLGLLTTIVLAALCLTAAVRSTTRPSVERRLAEVMASAKAPPAPSDCTRFPNPNAPLHEERRTVDDIVVVSECHQTVYCQLGVFSTDRAPAVVRFEDLPFNLPRCPEFEVTRLAPDLLLVRAAGQGSPFFYHPIISDALFRRRGGRWVLSSDENPVAGEAGPPRSWLAGGVLGLVLVIAAGWRRSDALRHARYLERIRQRTPSPDVGPDGEGEIIRWEAWALAISSLAAAPLAAAALAGLLW